MIFLTVCEILTPDGVYVNPTDLPVTWKERVRKTVLAFIYLATMFNCEKNKVSATLARL